MLNETYRHGDLVSLPVPAGKKSGDPVRIGGLNGVLATDRAKTDVAPINADGTPNTTYNYGGGNPDGNASVWLEGAFTFDVSFAVASVGLPVYIADGALAATGTDVFGHALTTKAAAAGPLTVRLAN